MNITYIISNIDLALEFQWVEERLNREEFKLSFIFLNQEPSKLHKLFLKKGVKSYELIYSGKKSLPLQVLKIRKLLKKLKPDIIHCHLFEGSLAGLIAAKSLGIKNRIYTRHHSTFHHDYAPSAVKYDRLINTLAKKVISISPVVTEVLTKMEIVPHEKIVTIEHGVDPSYFSKPANEAISEMKQKYGLESASPVIGMISRFDKWKGVSYAIEAFRKLQNDHPEAKLVIANAIGGDDAENIKNELGKLSSESYTLIEFETQIGILYDCFDVFVHVPVDKYAEAFGQIYIEAFFKEIPTVATKSGIGNSLITTETAVEASYKSSESIYRGIEKILNMSNEEKSNMTANAKASVENYFVFDRKLQQLEELYRNLNRE